MKKCYTKLWKVMKLCAAQAIVAMVVCGVSAARDNYAQLLDKKVSISLKQVSLETALHQLQDATDVKIFFSVEQIALGEPESITIEAKDKSLRDVLNELLTPYNIKYKVDERSATIIILKKDPDQSTSVEPEVAAQQSGSRSIRPSKLATITGKVTDAATQQPMAGVNIVVKGTINGTTTDLNGNYTIAADDKDILVFSFIGYASFETQVNERRVVDVTLAEDIKSLTEVVVNAGYYQVKEKEQTGNIGRISSEEISRQPVNNPLQAMIGRIPGVYIQQNSGVPGGSFTIQIRGRNSIRSDGNNPLYIVDGVPFTSTSLGSQFSGLITGRGNPLSNLNPSDIESIEVLKDADATAIYGSRGSNGVVLITTKKGKTGKSAVDVNFYQGVGEVSQKMNLLNSQQYLEMRREALSNDEGSAGSVNPDYDLLLWDTTRNTDWQNKLIGGIAHLTSAQASLSGGSAMTRFLLGGGYYRETTVFPGDFADKKYSARFNISHTSENGKLTASFSGSFLRDDNNLPSSDLTSTALQLPPVAPAIYDSQGNLNWEDNSWDNPYAGLRQKFQSKTGTLIANSIFSYEIFKGLQVKANLGYTDINLEETTGTPISSLNPADGITTGSSSLSTSMLQTWIAEPQIAYEVKLGNGKLTALAGATFQQSITDEKVLYATGYTSDAVLGNLQAASNVAVQSVSDIIYRYNAFFGRINYDWQGKYFLNLTGRRDGSSRFGPGKQFANFGAVGAAWIFTNEEAFGETLQVISFGKLRASYGSTGSDQIGDYGYYDLWTSSPNTYGGQKGVYPTNLYNSDYAWEVNRKLEIGVDLGFFKNHIFFNASYYTNRSSNQLVGYALPTMTGFSSIQANLPAKVSNSGLELVMESVNIKTARLSWTTSLNITIPRNELLSYPGIENSPYQYQYEIGKSLNVFKGYHQLGVDPQTGLYTFQDVDNNGSGTDYPADLQARKTVTQDYYGGLQNTLSYRGFEVDLYFQFVKQTGRNYLTGFSNVPGSMSNQPEWVLDRWQKPGDMTSIQKYTQDYSDAYAAYSTSSSYGDNTITDASFIRLKSASISYTLAGPINRTLSLQRSKVYVQCQNVLTVTNYLGLDPENQNFSSIPPLRVITAGIQITF